MKFTSERKLFFIFSIIYLGIIVFNISRAEQQSSEWKCIEWKYNYDDFNFLPCAIYPYGFVGLNKNNLDYFLTPEENCQLWNGTYVANYQIQQACTKEGLNCKEELLLNQTCQQEICNEIKDVAICPILEFCREPKTICSQEREVK